MIKETDVCVEQEGGDETEQRAPESMGCRLSPCSVRWNQLATAETKRVYSTIVEEVEIVEQALIDEKIASEQKELKDFMKPVGQLVTGEEKIQKSKLFANDKIKFIYYPRCVDHICL